MSTAGNLSNSSRVRKVSRPNFKGDPDSISVQNDRGHWGSRAEFILACLGYSVGLGNLWRFPYLAYENGGAAFLLPYLILLTVVGRPMYLMEVALGQYSQLGPLHTWKNVTPLMGGLGYAQLLKGIIGITPYMVMISYSLHYLYNSLAYIGHKLPWSTCDPSWADERCYVVGDQVPCSHYNLTAPTFDINCTIADQSSATQYWRHSVLSLDTEGIVAFGDLGSVKVGLVLCLLVGWVITCLSLLQGIKSSGKVVYFTATFPFIVLVVLTVAGVQLEGAYLGLRYLFVPQWEKLLEVNVWRLALEQCLYSLSVGGGGLVTFGSYNNFNTKVYVDVIILSVLDLFASMLCAVTVFSVLGAMAHELGYDDIKNVVASGPGLAFVAYPEAITRTLPIPHLWSALFFFMVLTLGLDSMFGGMESIITTVFDEFPSTRRHKPIVVSILCLVLFACGIPYCTEKGQYLFFLFDVFISGVGGLLFSLLSVVALHWVYGVDRFCNDLKFMMSYSPSWMMKVAWAGIAPITLFALFVGSMYRWKWPLYAGTIGYPTWAYALGGLLPVIVATPVIAFMIIHLVDKISSGISTLAAIVLLNPLSAVIFRQKWRQIRQPSKDWGPGCPVARQRLVEQNRLEEVTMKAKNRPSTKGGTDNAAFESTAF